VVEKGTGGTACLNCEKGQKRSPNRVAIIVLDEKNRAAEFYQLFKGWRIFNSKRAAEFNHGPSFEQNPAKPHFLIRQINLLSFFLSKKFFHSCYPF
jgi:hypothetical protein